jgi:hypothetical protein
VREADVARRATMRHKVVAIRDHPRGRIYEVAANQETVSILLTFHALERVARWGLTDRRVLRSLLYPEEIIRGHRNRFIAHRRTGRHVVRVVYEYEGKTPVVVTVYYPLAERYFQGGGIHEDQILS